MTVYRPDPALLDAAHNGVVFARTPRGLLRARGADRLDLLHRLSTNTTKDLIPLHETGTILTSDKGRVVEVLRVVALEDHLLLLLLGTDAEGVRRWLDKYTIMDDFTTEDATPEFIVFSVHGDYSKSLLRDTLGVEPPDAGSVMPVTWSSEGDLFILRETRLAGAGGFLVMAPVSAGDELAETLQSLGAVELDVPTWNTLRIESGLPQIGSELTESYNPLEAGLSQLISWTKGCYIGQEVIARLDTYDKVQRHLVGLKINGSLPDSPEMLIILNPDDGKKIGEVTSAAHSPAFGGTIALAFVRSQHAIPGATVSIAFPGDAPRPVAPAIIVNLPFDLETPN